MCGIFGVSLKQKTSETKIREAMLKVKILGLYNLSRGRDSCGITIEGEIYKGVERVKEWDKFIGSFYMPSPKKNLVVIGHTRSSTGGSAHTAQNAHPFLIADDMIGVHNGVVNNIDTLLRKYDLNPNDYKVDSHGFYALLQKEGYKVLGEYVGKAALAFTYRKDPNTLYLYHGASKDTKGGTLWEERPLYYMETPEGIYFSSTEESLEGIRGDNDAKPEKMNHNYVFQIKHGAFTEEQYYVSREDKNIPVSVNNGMGNAQRGAVRRGNQPGHGSKTNTASANASTVKHMYEGIIFRETLPLSVVQEKVDTNQVYFHYGRYWRFRRELLNGIFHVTAKGIIVPEKDATSDTPEYYFFKGVMVKDKIAYERLTKMLVVSTSFLRDRTANFAANIATFSKFPVTNLPDEAPTLQPYHKYAWYFGEGKRYSDTFTPKFSTRHYTVENAFLKTIKSAVKEQSIFEEYHSSRTEVTVFENGGNMTVMDPSARGGADNIAPFLRRNDLSAGTGGVPGSSPRLYNTSTKFEDRKNEPFTPRFKEGNYFYEQKFESFEEAMESVGPVEAEALREYVKTTTSKDSPVELNDREVEIQVCDIIVHAFQNKVSILDLCDTTEDQYTLKYSYQKILDTINERNFMEDVVNRGKQETDEEYTPDQYAKQVENFMEQVDKEDDKPEVNLGEVKTILNDTFEALQSNIMDAETLASETESDMCQELGAAIYAGVAKIQGNLAAIADKYNLKEEAAKFKSLNKKEN